MREVNFSIPSANKASVGITTALYDRRALDCTSTLPLINSLNHLAYLTTSSARIREILTIDGGVERLVCILKNGRSKDMMDTWKWNLAFQCVVNIGVRGSDPRGSDSRGSETIRTRVVEADVVPVLATILDNYIQVFEKSRARQEELESKSDYSRMGPSKRPFPREGSRTGTSAARSERRRQIPPPIEILPNNDPTPTNIDSNVTRTVLDVPTVPTVQPTVLSSPPDRSTLSSHRHHHHHHHHAFRPQGRTRGDEVTNFTPPPPPPPPNPVQLHRPVEPFARPRNPLLSRDIFAMPPMTPGQYADANSSQPDTPTTPTGPSRNLPTNRRRSASAPYPVHSSVQQDLTMSGDSDDGEITGPLQEAGQAGPSRNETVVDFQNDMRLDDIVERAVVLDTVDAAGLPAPDVTGDADAETFNITHRSMDGSIIDPVAAPPNPALDLSPIAAPFRVPDPMQLPTQPVFNQSYSPDRAAVSGLLASVPRDEDVIMSLQLLAYVSKYPSLRPYFQQSHLVPKLKISRSSLAFEGDEAPWLGTEEEDDNDDEYCQPDDYNIFPLVEKFTVGQQHPADVTYWAGVVMRNLCRKDRSRGDIRQCAYYKCGKWEESARQFAKCRRCRQTKYCSKECQKSAWVYHRHWCEPAESGQRRGHACPSGEHA